MRKLKRDGQTDGQTDGRTDGRADGPTDGPTDGGVAIFPVPGPTAPAGDNYRGIPITLTIQILFILYK